jgi:hypothetical protein
MAEAKLARSLQSLESEAKRLAIAANNTNQIIQAVQLRLKTANIGLEFWLDKKAFVVETAAGERTTLCLGYAKIENEWQIAVRVPPVDPMVSPFVLGSPKSPTPLTKTAREVRYEALQRLSELLDGITAKLSEKADRFESVALRLNATAGEK